MTITHILIRRQKCRKRTIQKLSNIVQSDQIKTNGSIAIKCNLEADILDVRKQIKELLNCSYGQIDCLYKESINN